MHKHPQLRTENGIKLSLSPLSPLPLLLSLVYLSASFRVLPSRVRVLLSKLALQLGPQLSREQRQHAVGVFQQPRRLPLLGNDPGAHDHNSVARDDVLEAVSYDDYRRLCQVGLDQLAD